MSDSTCILFQRDSKSRLKVLTNFSLNDQQSSALLTFLETEGQYGKIASVLKTITKTDGPVSIVIHCYSGLPRSGKNIWKMKFFPGQGKVREFSGWPGKFRKDLESLGKVREFENK